ALLCAPTCTPFPYTTLFRSKSVVAGLFAKRGVAVIETDEIAHELTHPGGEAIGAIRSAFGTSLIDADGALDRDAMRKLVFGDAADRKSTRLNSSHQIISYGV